MPRPGTDITIVDASAPAGPALGTGTAFMIGVSQRGPNDKALKVLSLKDFKVKFGARSGGSLLYDSVMAYFAEGGSELYCSRIIGAAAVTATVAGFGGCNCKAASPGAWGTGIKISAIAPPVASGSDVVVQVEYPAGTIVEQSPTMKTTDDIVTWGNQRSNYVRFSRLSATMPTVGTAVTTAGGTDDNTVDATTSAAALARFEYALGPGQVLAPGLTTAAVQNAVLYHVDDMRRCAILDAPDTATPASITAAATALYGVAGCRFTSLWAPWAIYPSETPPATVTVPFSGIEAGIIARVDRGGNPNAPAAGADGVSRLALGLSQSYSDGQRETFNSAGVDCAKLVYGEVRAYGYRTVAGPSDTNWLWYGNSRTVMAIAYECDAIAEAYVLKQIDGRGHIFSRLNKDLAGVCAKYYNLDALYGDAPEEAFSVNTGPAVNTIDTIKAGEIHAIVNVRISPVGEYVAIEIVKVPIDLAVAA